MSALVHSHIERIDQQLRQLEARIDALREVRDAISAVPVFTADEQLSVLNALEEQERQLADRQDARKRAVVALETTISQCESDLSERERVLNELFGRDVLGDHQDIMDLFRRQHETLKDTLTHSVPTDE